MFLLMTKENFFFFMKRPNRYLLWFHGWIYHTLCVSCVTQSCITMCIFSIWRKEITVFFKCSCNTVMTHVCVVTPKTYTIAVTCECIIVCNTLYQPRTKALNRISISHTCIWTECFLLNGVKIELPYIKLPDIIYDSHIIT